MTNHEDDRPLQDYRASDFRLETLAKRIVEAAGPELARRRQEDSLWLVLTGWTKPVLSAAAVWVLVSASVLGFASAGEADLESSSLTLAEALLPEELAPMYYDGNEFTLAELVSALERDFQ